MENKVQAQLINKVFSNHFSLVVFFNTALVYLIFTYSCKEYSALIKFYVILIFLIFSTIWFIFVKIIELKKIKNN